MPVVLMYNMDRLLPVIKEALGALVTELVSVGRRGEPTYKEYLELIETVPILGSTLDIISLLGTVKWGEYTHEDEKIQEDIRGQFEGMQGSLLHFIEEQFSAYAMGHCLSQWGVEPKGGLPSLMGLQTIPPDLYHFRFENGYFMGVTFQYPTGQFVAEYGTEDARLLHVLGNRAFTYGHPRGKPAMRRVTPLCEAWKLMMAEWLIASQRQATPIIVGYADSGIEIPLLDEYGQPMRDADGQVVSVSAPTALLQQLTQIENRSVISTDVRNRVEALSQQTDGQIFIQGIPLLERQIMTSLAFPETMLIVSGQGDSNLNSGQRETLDLILNAINRNIENELIDKAIRKLIVWRHGEQDSWGEFNTSADSQEDVEQITGILERGANVGYLSASDLDTVNRYRELAGLPIQTELPTVEVFKELDLESVG